MNQRERLIELLCSVECAGEEGFGNCPQRRHSRCSRLEGLEMCQIGAIADRLLANGVIVPPVKVGDKIYQTDGVRVYENEVCEISLSKRTVIYYTESAVAFDETAIGKSVFLTREEAEQALKGGEG